MTKCFEADSSLLQDDGTKRGVEAEPGVFGCWVHALRFEDRAEQVMAAIEVAGEDRRALMGLGERLARVGDVGPEHAAREDDLLLDDAAAIVAGEQEADHDVVEELLVERRDRSTNARLAAAPLEERGAGRIVIGYRGAH